MLFEVKEVLDGLATPIYKLRGSMPWTAGYYTVKKKTICSAIDARLLSGGVELPERYGHRIDERAVEYPWVFAQLPKLPGKVLDAGSALNHRFLLERAPLRDAQLTIMTLAPEKRCYWHRAISYVYGDLREPYFASASFDTVVSVSTIEHVGLDNTLLYTGDAAKRESDDLGFIPAVKEFRRILKPGGRCLITVPFGKKGVHGWYQVFDAKLVAQVVDAFAPTTYGVDYFAYSADGWMRSTPNELVDAEFHDVHSGQPFAADFAAGARGVACIKLIA